VRIGGATRFNVAKPLDVAGNVAERFFAGWDVLALAECRTWLDAASGGALMAYRDEPCSCPAVPRRCRFPRGWPCRRGSRSTTSTASAARTPSPGRAHRGPRGGRGPDGVRRPGPTPRPGLTGDGRRGTSQGPGRSSSTGGRSATVSSPSRPRAAPRRSLDYQHVGSATGTAPGGVRRCPRERTLPCQPERLRWRPLPPYSPD
jgi:hypothetical protein